MIKLLAVDYIAVDLDVQCASYVQLMSYSKVIVLKDACMRIKYCLVQVYYCISLTVLF